MTRFLVDAMCGDLLAYLRMCGHDTAFAPDRGLEADDAVRAAAEVEGRTILTRDRELASRADDAILLESQDTEAQLRSLADAGVDLDLAEEPERCGRCNGPLARAEPGSDESTPQDAPDPAVEPVWRCTDCGQRFWRGSHWDRVAATLEGIRHDTGRR